MIVQGHSDWKLYAYCRSVLERIAKGEQTKLDDTAIIQLRQSYTVTEAEQEAIADLLLNGLKHEGKEQDNGM